MYNIVIVEDEYIESESLKRIVSRCVENSVIHEASTGKKAIQLIDELNQIDMMLVDINIPLLREGELLDENDKRGCLVEERFAVAQNLSLGSRIGVKLSGQEYDFVVRGIVVSPEYIVVSNGLVANPDAYGYLLVNACAIPTLPLTQIVANIDDRRTAKPCRRRLKKPFRMRSSWTEDPTQAPHAPTTKRRCLKT